MKYEKIILSIPIFLSNLFTICFLIEPIFDTPTHSSIHLETLGDKGNVFHLTRLLNAKNKFGSHVFKLTGLPNSWD